MDLAEVEKFEAVKVLKLSEAIRIGAKIRPQCFHSLFKNGGSCVLGAAYEGATGKADAVKHCQVSAIFPELRALKHNDLGQVGWDMFKRNDDGESRESIADWLESKGY